MNKVFSFWCEYDVGQEYILFSTREIAEREARSMVEDQGLDYDDLCEDGLIGIEEKRVINE